MYYGEGAGNRRKMIKAKVDQRSKDAAYKKAFDNHVANTNWEKRGKQARGKRRRQDVKNSANLQERESNERTLRRRDPCAFRCQGHA